MAPVTSFSILVFASSALAVPYGHGHNHHHHFSHPAWSSWPHGYGSGPSGSPVAPISAAGTGTGAPFPYPAPNSTVYGATGTGLATGTGNGIPTSYAPPPVGPATASSVTSVNNVGPTTASEEECTTDVTVTSTEKITVTVTAEGESTSSAEVAPVGGSSHIQSTVHLTATMTVTPPSYSAPESSSAEVAPVGGSSHGQSTVHVAVTTTVKPPSYSAPASSSSEAAAVAASSSVGGIQKAHSHVWGPPHQHTHSSSSAVVAPVSTSSSVYVAPTSESSSSVEVAPTTPSSSSVYVAPTSVYVPPPSTSSVEVAPTTAPSSSSVWVAPTTSSKTSAVAAATTTSGGSGSGKRGVAYNDASLTECFQGSSEISWGFNWGSSSSGLTGFKYTPMLWGPTSDFTGSWQANAQAALDSGADTIFSFNEADLSSQSNLSPEAAASAYKQYIEPFAGKAKLCAPSVTNGGGAMGLTWLMNFLDACSDCTIDCVNIHWYDSADNAGYFKAQVENATSIANGKEVYVSEFGATGSDDEISTFLEEVMPWMDAQDAVKGYAYFMVSDGLLVNGNEPSTYGATYKNFTP